MLVDGGTIVNIMSHSILRKIGKFDTDLRPHNMVLTSYEGKTSASIGIIQVDVMVGTIARTTLFVFILTKENYNMLLGRKWIHGVRHVPSTMH